MTTHIAFLRAINVGTRRVSMERLRTSFEELGFDDVSTFIASGNVIFASPHKGAELEPQIESALSDALGFEVVPFVRSTSRLAALANRDPFPDSADRVHVGFLKKSPPAAARRALEALSNETDVLTTRGREIYWLARAGMGRATVSGATIEKALGQATTLRSMKMLRRLIAKLD
jgi:uncharacterized protein (DUF1697 family)